MNTEEMGASFRVLAWNLSADFMEADAGEFVTARGITLTPPGLGIDSFDDIDP